MTTITIHVHLDNGGEEWYRLHNVPSGKERTAFNRLMHSFEAKHVVIVPSYIQDVIFRELMANGGTVCLPGPPPPTPDTLPILAPFGTSANRRLWMQQRGSA